jgi:hypothetical protein
MRYSEIQNITHGKYNVPESVFDAEFADFVKSYDGKINGKSAPAWRAFEINYRTKNKSEVENVQRQEKKEKKQKIKEEKIHNKEAEILQDEMQENGFDI